LVLKGLLGSTREKSQILVRAHQGTGKHEAENKDKEKKEAAAAHQAVEQPKHGKLAAAIEI